MTFAQALNLGALVLAVSLTSYAYSIYRIPGFVFLAIAWFLNLVYIVFLEPLLTGTDTWSAGWVALNFGSLSTTAILVALHQLSPTWSRAALYKVLAIALLTYSIAFLLDLIPSIAAQSDDVRFAIVSAPHAMLAFGTLFLLGRRLHDRFSVSSEGDSDLISLLLSMPIHIYACLQLTYPLKLLTYPITVTLIQGVIWVAIGCKLAHVAGLGALLSNRRLRRSSLRNWQDRVAEQAHIVLGGLTHEQKTPIQALRNYLAALNLYQAKHSHAMDEQLTSIIGGIAEQAKRIVVIHDEMAVMGDPLETTRTEPLAINSVLDEAYQAFERAYGPTQIRVRREFARGLIVEGNAARLLQVFGNIFRNALEAMAELPSTSPPRSRQLLIRTSRTLTADGERCLVRIRDNGSGMTPDVQRRLYTPYFTTKVGTNRGLGMFLTRTLLRSMNSEIAVSSPPEGETSGTELSIFLRLAE